MNITLKVPDNTVKYLKKAPLILGMMLSFGFMYYQFAWHHPFREWMTFGVVPLIAVIFFFFLYALAPNTQRYWVLAPTLFTAFWTTLLLYDIYHKLDDFISIMRAFLVSSIQYLIMWMLCVRGGKLFIHFFDRWRGRDRSAESAGIPKN